MNKKEFIKQIVIRPDNLGVASDPDLIGVKIDGNQVYVEIKDKRLLDAIVSMDIGTADGVIQKLGLITRFLSFVNTSLNPEFVIGNFSRDVETAIFNILGEQEMSEGKAKDQKLIQRVLKDTIPSIGAFYKGITNKPSISIQDKFLAKLAALAVAVSLSTPALIISSLDALNVANLTPFSTEEFVSSTKSITWVYRFLNSPVRVPLAISIMLLIVLTWSSGGLE